MTPKHDWQKITQLAEQIKSQIMINVSGNVTNDKQPYTYMFDDCRFLFLAIDNYVNTYKNVISFEILKEWSIEKFHDSMIILKGMIDTNRMESDTAVIIKNSFSEMFHFMRRVDFSASIDEMDLSIISEVAFNHLQRLLIADLQLKQTWVDANGNERTYERLGSTHMMMHGIYAFKAGSTKQETDLIYRDTPFKDDVDYRIFRGIVLTEWKSCKRLSPKKASENAIDQAKDYASGTLMGLELKRVRYIVLVSERRIKMPDDVIDGITTYKHVNISIDPLSSSAGAGSRRITKGV